MDEILGPEWPGGKRKEKDKKEEKQKKERKKNKKTNRFDANLVLFLFPVLLYGDFILVFALVHVFVLVLVLVFVE